MKEPYRSKCHSLLLTRQATIDERERNRLAEAIIRLVDPYLDVLARTYTRGAPSYFDDAKQVCRIGALRAMDRWQADKNVPFLNYASFWIRRELNELRQADLGGAIRVPQEARRQGRVPVELHSPKYVVLDMGAVGDAWDIKSSRLKMEHGLVATNEGVYNTELRQQREWLAANLHKLSPGEQKAVSGRLAGKSLEALAQEQGCTRQWISAAEVSGLQKLQQIYRQEKRRRGGI